MFESIKTGWKLTKVSFSMLMEEKKLLVFPFLSAVFSILLLIGFLFPFLITGVLSNIGGLQQIGSVVVLALLFVYYICTSFLAIFFNVALVHSIKAKIEGEGESITQSIGFAFSRFGTILPWAIISALVGMILNAIESSARNTKGAGKIVLFIIKGVIGLAWTILTFFVIPVIVYQNLGVVDTIKKSGEILKNKWGEALTANFSTGIILGLVMLAWIIFGAIAVFVTIAINVLLGVLVAGLFFFGFLVLLLVNSAISQVYRTLLFLYAEQGVTPPGLDENEAQFLFRK